jgi:hypothetical protein
MKFRIFITLLASIFLTSCVTETANKRIAPINIGILMPLTGINAHVGQRAATMIELGLEDGLEGNIKVMTYDIADDDKTTLAVNRLKSRGTNLVLGPIFSLNSSDIASRIASQNITMITLSNNPALAKNGVYVFGHSPAKQTERMINYMLDNGFKDFIVMLPAGKYSQELTQIIGSIVTDNGGKLAHSEFYTSREESIHVAVDNIAKLVANINELEETSHKPVLYISDDAVELENVVSELKKHNLDVTTMIVGDNKIDVEYNNPISYLFTGSLEYNSRDLLSRLQTRVPEVKHLNYMDLMSYDLGLIASYNLGAGLSMEQFIQRMDSGHLHTGSSGYIKFVDHVADRKYDIIKYDQGKYEVIDSSTKAQR